MFHCSITVYIEAFEILFILSRTSYSSWSLQTWGDLFSMAHICRTEISIGRQTGTWQVLW